MEKSVKCCYLVCAGEMKTPLNIEKKPFGKIIAVDGGLKNFCRFLRKKARTKGKEGKGTFKGGVLDKFFKKIKTICN